MKLSEQVKKSQVQNILAKLKRGATITRSEQAMVAAYEAGIEPDLTLEAVAKHFDISKPAALKLKRRMSQLGHRFNSIEAIERFRAEAGSGGGGDITVARLEKLRVEIEWQTLKNDREKGRLLPAAEVQEEAQVIAALLCSEGAAMIGDLPGQLAGKSEVEIRKRVKARWDQLLVGIQKRLEEICPKVQLLASSGD